MFTLHIGEEISLLICVCLENICYILPLSHSLWLLLAATAPPEAV